MPERKARQAVGAGTADCGWGTATRRPCGSGDAERKGRGCGRTLHGGRRRLARRRGAASTGSATGYGADRDGAFQPIRSGPGQLPGRVQDAARTPYLGRGCAQDGIGGAAEARAGGDGVRPSRGTESRALTNRSTGRSGRAMARAALRRGRRSDTRRSARPPRRAGSGGPQATRRRNQARRGGRAGPVGRHGKPRCDN